MSALDKAMRVLAREAGRQVAQVTEHIARTVLESAVEDVASTVQSESFCDGYKSMSDEDATRHARRALGLAP